MSSHISELEKSLNDNPVTVFEHWYALAKKRDDIDLPEAACLSTIGPDNMPEGRWVLIRDISENGFTFFTNEQSDKGTSLATHPVAALTVYWHELGIQVRIKGTVKKISDAESDAYFESRPRQSQIGAWASLQSRELDARQVLTERMKDFEEKYKDGPVPRPPHWLGYRVAPIAIEFWQEQPYRLHDRFRFEKQSEGHWTTSRLYP